MMNIQRTEDKFVGSGDLTQVVMLAQALLPTEHLAGPLTLVLYMVGIPTSIPTIIYLSNIYYLYVIKRTSKGDEGMAQ